MNKNYLTIAFLGLLLIGVTALFTYQITIKNYKSPISVKDSLVYIQGMNTTTIKWKERTNTIIVLSDSTNQDALKCDSTIVDDTLNLKVRVYTNDFKRDGVNVDYWAKLATIIETKTDTLIRETLKYVPVPQYEPFFGIKFYTGTFVGFLGGLLLLWLSSLIIGG